MLDPEEGDLLSSLATIDQRPSRSTERPAGRPTGPPDSGGGGGRGPCRRD